MTRQEASSVVDLPVEHVYARLSAVEEWPRFLTGVRSVRRTSFERFVFTVTGGVDGPGRTRDVEVAVGHHPKEHRIAWHALAGPAFDGELRMAEAGPGHTRVALTLVAEPTGFIAGVSEMVGATSPAAVLDVQRLEELLTAPAG
ncbi:SRPBCC family protein [Kineosporia sp. A_224]|uniref:SRPBCC family protein n=1 Tax=Kineosporia sp. A_224 TaxID=1962180 RepID=UPI000B4BCE9E|nr:SRPBCC family protein [Kineosporia sp. A_224]